jgi:hypothetical protein
MATWRPQNRLNHENQKSSGRIAQSQGILTPSLIEIAPAVTKRDLLMDDLLMDDDGHYVIAIAHLVS